MPRHSTTSSPPTLREMRLAEERRLWEQGLLSQAIAEQTGVARATVKEDLRGMGLKPHMPPVAMPGRGVGVEVQRLRRNHPRMSIVEMAAHTGVSHQRIKQILDRAGLPAARLALPRPHCSVCGKARIQIRRPWKTGMCRPCQTMSHQVELTCANPVCSRVFHRARHELEHQRKMRQKRGLPIQRRWYCGKTCVGMVLGREYGIHNLRRAWRKQNQRRRDILRPTV